MAHDHSQPAPQAPPFWGSRYSLGLLVLGGIGLFFLLSEHRAHVLSALPLLLLLACPLMHLFMHRGHGGHGHSHGQRSEGAGSNDGDVP
jgi:hypothetical protein